MPEKNEPWFNLWPADVPKNIEYPQVPLQNILRKSAWTFPEKTALACGEREITFAQLEAFSNQFANALAKLGIKKGKRVALFLPNIPEFAIAYFGILKLGAVATALSPLHREREVEYQLCDSEASAIVALDSLVSIIDNVGSKTNLRNLIYTSLSGVSEANAGTKPNVWSFWQLLKEAPETAPEADINPRMDLAVLQYTGGTTGTPKAAMLTHRNLLSNALAFASWINGKPAREVFLTALPLSHIYGMTTSLTVPVSLAAKMVLLPRFKPAEVLDAVQRHGVTVFCGVPTMYQALLANPELGSCDLTSIRVCISGASSLPPNVQKRFMQVTGGLLVEGYGLTEASPVTHCNPVDATMRTVKVGSIGLPLPDTEARIVDLETGEPLPQGETGELAVKGPQVMKGYWRRPQETASVLRDGWLLTGDIARMDGDGYFYITDRKKDLIKTGGYSVYPRELEDVLYEHPAVKLCAVVGKPDQRAGEIPKAYIVLKENASATTEELIAFVNGKVASYKTIREIEFRKELPISSAGKVLRSLLKQHHDDTKA